MYYEISQQCPRCATNTCTLDIYEHRTKWPGGESEMTARDRPLLAGAKGLGCGATLPCTYVDRWIPPNTNTHSNTQGCHDSFVATIAAADLHRISRRRASAIARARKHVNKSARQHARVFGTPSRYVFLFTIAALRARRVRAGVVRSNYLIRSRRL